MSQEVHIEGDRQGLGDLICRCYAAQGLRKKGFEPVFWSDRDDRRWLLTKVMDFQTRQGPRPGGTYNGEDRYGDEVALRIQPSRADIYSQFMPHHPDLIRPWVKPIAEEQHWAKEHVRSGAEKLVILSPFSAWLPRSWSTARWVDVAWRLHNKGIRVVTFLENEHAGKGPSFPIYFRGYALKSVLAAIQEADLVLANDSGLGHIGGLFQKPTMVVCGPTVNIFNQYETVEEVRVSAERFGCVGCSFSFPFRKACDFSCQAMDEIQPEEVVERVLAVLEGDPIKKPKSLPHKPWDYSWIKYRETGQGTTDAEAIKRTYFLDEYRLRALQATPRRVLDVGGHIGTFAHLARDLWPDCEVASIEANRLNIPFLQHNADARSGVSVFYNAVWYGDDDVVLYDRVDIDNTGGSFVSDRRNPVNPEGLRQPWHKQELRKITLEKVMDELRWLDVDLLKLDVEGSELNILQNVDFNRLGQPIIVGEWHNNRDEVMATLHRRLPGHRVDVMEDHGVLGLFRALPDARRRSLL